MKIAHRKAQAETPEVFQASYFQWALTTNMFRRIALLTPSGMTGEVAVNIPEEAQTIDVAGELTPPAHAALNAQRVCIDPNQPPGKLLATEREKLLPLRVLPLMGAGASLLDFLLHVSLLSRALKAKGLLLPSITKL